MFLSVDNVPYRNVYDNGSYRNKKSKTQGQCILQFEKEAIITLPLPKCGLDLFVHCSGYIALGLNHYFQYIEHNGEEEVHKTQDREHNTTPSPSPLIQQ